MKGVYSSLILIVGLFLLMQVQPSAQVVAPPFVVCSGGGLLYMSPFSGAEAKPVEHCVDPAILRGQQGPAGPQGAPGIQGVVGPQGPAGSPGSGQLINSIACPAPGAGSIVYASFVDANGNPTGSCLPLIVVQSATAALMIPGQEVPQAAWAQQPPDWTPGAVYQVFAMAQPTK